MKKKARHEIAMLRYKNNERMTLSQFTCFIIGVGYCSDAWRDFINFIKQYRKDYPRKYNAWNQLRLDWHTFRTLDEYRYNV